MLDSNANGKSNAYYIVKADYCTVGEAWNRNIWDPRNNPTGYHALYYRTDHTESKAVLHMLDGRLELLPGWIYFVPAYSVLYSEIEGEMQKYYIHFQCDFIDFGLYRHRSDMCRVPADDLTQVLFDSILTNYSVQTPAAQQKVRGAMDILLADLLERLAVQERDVHRFQPVLQYIQSHFRENLTVRELAEMMNLSPVYFSNAFKAAFHVTPKQYILGKRLFESQQLLIKTDLTVKEVAEMTGFVNENYFSEFFSGKVGIPALKFRAMARRG